MQKVPAQVPSKKSVLSRNCSKSLCDQKLEMTQLTATPNSNYKTHQKYHKSTKDEEHGLTQKIQHF
jgi:hypothetical protein